MSGPYNYRWRQCRLHFLRAHPLCVMCEQRGRIVAAGVVDHIEAHRGNVDLFWRESNWQALCKRCHDSRKQMLENPNKVLPDPSWNRAGGGLDG